MRCTTLRCISGRSAVIFRKTCRAQEAGEGMGAAEKEEHKSEGCVVFQPLL